MKHRVPVNLPSDLTIGESSATGAASYSGATTIYDALGAAGAMGSGAVQAGDTIYDQAGAMGTIGGATVLPPETTR